MDSLSPRAPRAFSQWKEGSSRDSKIFCKHCMAIIKAIHDHGRVDDDWIDYPARSRASIKQTASENCSFCFMILNHSKFKSPEENPSVKVRWKAHRYGEEDDVDAGYAFTISGETYGVGAVFKITPTFDIAAYRPSLPWTTIDSLKLAKKWLQDCEKHENCNILGRSHFVPTRLIRLGESKDSPPKPHLSLEEDTPPGTPYTTLSHCWGQSLPIRLLKETLRSMKVKIPFETMPKTFQDAIVVARHLGYRYIWIDSLCIIQDSISDWQRESALMKDVYSSARCNISATAAANSLDGLFYSHQESMTWLEVPLPLTSLRPNSRIKGYGIVKEDFWDEEIEEGSLNRRGWVLQERILSRCNLHFGQRQVFWECSTLSACQTFPHGIPEPGYQYDISKHHFKANYGAMLRPPTEEKLIIGESVDRFLTAWYGLIEQYSRRQLTRQSDRLVAISGLATLFSVWFTARHSYQPKYLAGIWDYDIPSQLLWGLSYDARSGIENNIKDDLFDVAPSWSWASVTGSIRWYDTKDYSNFIPLVTLLSSFISLLNDQEPFGQVTGGTIQLSGKLITGKYYTYLDEEKKSTMGAVDMRLKETDWESPQKATNSRNVWLDNPQTPGVYVGATMYLLPIRYDMKRYSSFAQPNLTGSLEGLVLLPVGRLHTGLPSQYRRIGTWRTFTDNNANLLLCRGMEYMDNRYSELRTETCEGFRELQMGDYKAFKISII